MYYYCEICGDYADVHHIVHKSEGGLDFKLNYKYLCKKHHRSKNGPHKDKIVDLNYKLEMQNNLNELFKKNFYPGNEVKEILGLTPGSLKKLTKNLKLYKEGFSREDLIFNLMGRKIYSEEYIEDFILQRAINCL
ncbi:HNH endonuclease signature motif containing protein [Clostridium sp.]|uniref:HNH endonuclease signature motif containing protein n=1 Tax=Clostridium sp. TaxID=1506 RepID=UPI002638930D|nr:HNH endonuclease signature motif containing protein [Clostridium sp.]